MSPGFPCMVRKIASKRCGPMEIALFQRDVGDSWSYEHSYTLRERLLSDAHILPCTQRSALRDFDGFTRVNCCGVLPGCMCKPRGSWRRRWYFSGTRKFLRLLVTPLPGQCFRPGIRSMLLLFRSTTCRMSLMHFLLWSGMTTTVFTSSRPFR